MSYGFIKKLDKVDKEVMLGVSLASLSITTDFDGTGLNNHCAFTTATNILKMMGFDDVSFDEVYRYIKSGPVLFMEPRVKKIIKNRKTSVKVKRKYFPKTMDIVKAIDEGHITAMLLIESVKSAHWIIVTGYAISKGDIYLKVFTNWYHEARYYKVNSGSKAVMSLEFYI
ncbi:hypothetical protein [Fenollaria sporofastidiosus]|uniref:hypothetical protein n=1 Tax=Fenollaria sporofastidiosus TaxID=2811778 RepID=UPI001C000813|nr:hypothetical protein [Fenollaria sporofastidiosus]